MKPQFRKTAVAVLAALTAPVVLAQAPESIAAGRSFWLRLEEGFTGTLVYSLTGALLMIACFRLVDLFLPGRLSEQLIKDKNVALGIFLGSVMIGLALIISAAITG